MLFDKDRNRVYGRKVHGLSSEDEMKIRAYLQGAVYCWCNTRRTDWFSASDFLGGANFYWEGTPTAILYYRHINGGKTPEYAFDQAGKSAGIILKSILSDDKRIFIVDKQFKSLVYHWDGKSDEELI